MATDVSRQRAGPAPRKATISRPGAAGRRRSAVATFILLVLGAIFVLLPLVWLLYTSFQKSQNAAAIPPHWFARPTAGNFSSTLSGAFGHSLINSAIVAGGSTAIALLLGVPAGYAMARASVPGGRLFNAWFILAYVAPPVVFIVPLYVIYEHIGLLDTYQGLIAAYETGLLPFTIWLMRVYFADIPRELDEAAWLDGCSRLRALWRVVLPSAWPAVTTVGLLVALASWGEFFTAVIITGPRTQTAPVAIQAYVGSANMASDWGQLAACGLMVVVPAVAATVVVQRGLLRGVTSGMAR